MQCDGKDIRTPLRKKIISHIDLIQSSAMTSMKVRLVRDRLTVFAMASAVKS